MLIPTLTRRQRRPVDFGRWRTRRVTATAADVAGWPLDSYAVTLASEALPDAVGDAVDRVAEALLELRIFPSHLVTLWADTPDGRAVVGATVVQHIAVGPVTFVSAVRIVGIDDDRVSTLRRFALTWATVEGHPERGVETFAVAARPDGGISVTIQARSRPASRLVRLGSPFARWLQRRYSRAALANLAAIGRADGTRT